MYVLGRLKKKKKEEAISQENKRIIPLLPATILCKEHTHGISFALQFLSTAASLVESHIHTGIRVVSLLIMLK